MPQCATQLIQEAKTSIRRSNKIRHSRTTHLLITSFCIASEGKEIKLFVDQRTFLKRKMLLNSIYIFVTRHDQTGSSSILFSILARTCAPKAVFERMDTEHGLVWGESARARGVAFLSSSTTRNWHPPKHLILN